LTELLRRRLGQAGPWPAEVYRHVAREARAHGLEPAAWLAQAEKQPRELASLIAAATVGHTTFFRHPDHFDSLRDFAMRAAERTPMLRVWCAGCSTGEEAWSLALCIAELGLPFQIWATDINSLAVEVARRGTYAARSTSGLPGQAGKQPWRAPEALRRVVRFSVGALSDALPGDVPPRFDIIFCRNVLIYLETTAVRDAWRKFMSRLEPWGAIAVSPVESLSHVPAQLERVGPLGWFEHVEPKATPRAKSMRPAAKKSIAPAKPLDDIDSLLDAAAQRLSQGETEAAERDLHKVLAQRDDAVGWFLLGEACARRGEKTQARIAYTRAASAPHVPANVDLDTIRDAARRRSQQLGTK
jgi:chemotaxis protein methyltransferase CheR